MCLGGQINKGNPIESKQLDRLLGAVTEKKAATTERTKRKDQQSDSAGNRDNTPPPASSGASTAGASGISGLTGDVTATNGGQGRGGCGGYCRRNHVGRRSGTGRGPGSLTNNNSIRDTTTFKGREDAIKGNVYNIVNPSTSASMFITTTEEIAEYAGRTFKMGNHVKISM